MSKAIFWGKQVEELDDGELKLARDTVLDSMYCMATKKLIGKLPSRTQALLAYVSDFREVFDEIDHRSAPSLTDAEALDWHRIGFKPNLNREDGRAFAERVRKLLGKV